MPGPWASGVTLGGGATDGSGPAPARRMAMPGARRGPAASGMTPVLNTERDDAVARTIVGA